MAERGNIGIRIALEGAANIAKQLDSIRRSAGAAFKAVGDYGKGLSDSTARLGESASLLGERLGTVRDRALALGAAAGGAVAAFAGMVGGTAQSVADEARKVELATKTTQISAERIQKLAYAAKKRAGMEFDEFVDLLRDFQVRVGEARAGETMPLESFARIGVTKRDIDRLSTEKLLELYMKKIGEAKNRALVQFQVDELLSDAGSRALPLFRTSAKELQAIIRDGQRKGAFFSDKDLTAAAAYRDQLGRLTGAFDGLKRAAGVTFIGPLTEAFKRLGDYLDKNELSIKGFLNGLVRDVMPVVEDLLRLLDGRQAQTSFVQGVLAEYRQLKSAAEQVAAAVGGAWEKVIRPAFEAAKSAVVSLTGAINLAFGTSLRPEEVGVVLVLAKILGLTGLVVPAIALLGSAIGVVWTALSGLGGLIVAGLTAIGAPVALTIAAIAAVGAAIAGLVVYWDDVKRAVAAFSSFMQDVFAGILTVMDRTVRGFVDGVLLGFSGIATVIENTVRGFIDAWGQALGWLGDRLGAVADVVGSLVSQAAELLGLTNAGTATVQVGGLAAAGVGMGSVALPNYAAGGGQAPTKNLTLSIGGQEFGAQADDKTVDALERYLRKTGASSAQRKPGWFGG